MDPEEPPGSRITGGELLVRILGLAAVVCAVVALLLGHELVAVFSGFLAVALIIAGGSGEGVGTWERGERWTMSESEFDDRVDEVEQRPLERAAARERRDPGKP